MPAGADATAQIETLDRLSQQNHAGEARLASPVRRAAQPDHLRQQGGLERLHQDKPAATAGYEDFYGLSRRLALISQLIKRAGLTTGIYYTHLDGFDTHSGQLQRYARA